MTQSCSSCDRGPSARPRAASIHASTAARHRDPLSGGSNPQSMSEAAPFARLAARSGVSPAICSAAKRDLWIRRRYGGSGGNCRVGPSTAGEFAVLSNGQARGQAVGQQPVPQVAGIKPRPGRSHRSIEQLSGVTQPAWLRTPICSPETRVAQSSVFSGGAVPNPAGSAGCRLMLTRSFTASADMPSKPASQRARSSGPRGSSNMMELEPRLAARSPYEVARYESVAMCRASWDFLRAALLRWIRPRVAKRSRIAAVSRKAEPADSASCAAKTFLIAVRIRDRCARLWSRRAPSCRSRFSALLLLAKASVFFLSLNP